LEEEMDKNVGEDLEKHEPPSSYLSSIFDKELTSIVTNDSYQMSQHYHVHKIFFTGSNKKSSFTIGGSSATRLVRDVKEFLLVGSSKD
jgi:hypothetical protein